MIHPIDTTPRVATCPRCKSIVLAASSAGFRTAVDPSPMGFDEMRDNLIAGHDVFRLHMSGPKPVRLERVTVASLRSPAAAHATYAISHGCGCHAMDASLFEEPVKGPQWPSATSGGLAGGPLPIHAPAASQTATQGPSPAQPANRHRSEELPAVRCAKCKQLIEVGDGNRFMIEWPVWDEYTHKVPNRGTRKGYEKTHEGWGTKRWAIHSDGCENEKS